jgi:hypothetical protein
VHASPPVQQSLDVQKNGFEQVPFSLQMFCVQALPSSQQELNPLQLGL